MNYFSLNNRTNTSTFENAVIRGIAPDKGLYFPQEIPSLEKDFFSRIDDLSAEEIGYEVIKGFIGEEIPEEALKEIISQTLDFEFPVVPVKDQIGVLELFHGPTLAFKDVGARFMAGCLGYFVRKNQLGKVTVLVATSGDTGGAVANGFLGVEGIEVVILYPKGKVSEIQEKQLTTLGQNITALEVRGSFDDCQDMVKQAFLDEDIRQKRQLTSANSINVARWLPQMFYYFLAWKQLKQRQEKLVFSVPSGNFGNICAGMLAREMGLPIAHFVAANNANDVVTRYLKTAEFAPRPSVHTLSNAMDIGNPSNFVRVLELFNNQFAHLKGQLSSFSYSDQQTTRAIKQVYEQTGYMMDPHGAVGYLGLREFQKDHPEYYGVFLETAHPVKFQDTVEGAVGSSMDLSNYVKGFLNKEKQSTEIDDYHQLKSYLIN